MGLLTYSKPLKNFMMGVTSKFSIGVSPPSLLCPSLSYTQLTCEIFTYSEVNNFCCSCWERVKIAEKRISDCVNIDRKVTQRVMFNHHQCFFYSDALPSNNDLSLTISAFILAISHFNWAFSCSRNAARIAISSSLALLASLDLLAASLFFFLLSQ